MLRRWFGVVLVLWGVFASLLVSAPFAQAAGETYAFSGNNITASGGVFPSSVTLTPNGTCNLTTLAGCTYTGKLSLQSSRGACTSTFTIKLAGKVTSDSGGYQGAITTARTTTTFNPGCPSAPNNALIIITDPNGTGPGSGNPPSSTGTGTGPSDDTPTCDAGSLTWAICPVISFVIDVVDNIRQDILVPFLKEPPLSTTSTINGKAGQPNPVYQIWAAFRDVASVFFILVFFLIIFGTAIGFDNYTIKKVLPHLIAGAILMPFSWYICALLIDTGNVLGQGLFALANTFIPAPTIDFSSSLSQLLLGGTGAAGLALISFAFSSVAEIGLGVLFTILFAVLAALFTLVLRKILIIMFVILSPFALLAWILPNTQKAFKFWWTGLLRLVLMYPLIMLLFEAGRIFALTAGTLINTSGSIRMVSSLLITAVTHNPFTALVPLAALVGSGQAYAAGTDTFASAAVPFLQLLGLFLPLAAVPWTFKWAGGAMSLGSGFIQKGRQAANNRFGHNSDWDKNRAEMRKQRAMLQSNNDNHALGGFGRAWARNRAGMGGGLGGMQRGNQLQQLRYKQASDDAYKTRTAVNAINAGRPGGRVAAGGAVPTETHQQRLAAETQAATNQLTDERAGRAGLNQATNSTGGSPSFSTRYNAGLEGERRKQSVEAGEHEAIVLGNRNPQASSAMAGAAVVTGMEAQAKLRGGTTGALQHETDLDEAAVVAAATRLGGGPITDPAQRASIIARDRRVRFNTATRATAGATSEELGAHLGDQSGRVRDEREEERAALIAAAGSGRSSAEVLAEVRRNRTATTVGSAAETKFRGQAKVAGERTATLNDAITNPLSRDQLAQSAQDITEGKLGVDAGVVRGNIEGTQDAVEKAKRLAQLQGRGRISDQEARQDVMRAGAGAYQNLTRRQIQSAYGQNLGTLDDQAANPLHAEERINAARTNQGKAMARESSVVRSTNKTAKAQARSGGIRNAGSDAAFQAAARTSFDAGVETQTQALSEAVGAERAAIRSGKAIPLGAADYMEDSARAKERQMGAESGATRDRLIAARAAEQELVTAGATAGKPISRDQARDQLITNAADTGGRRAYIDTQKQYITDRNTLTGHQRAIENAMDDAKKAGAPLTRDEAEAQVYASFASADERDAHNAAMGEYATARGVVEARAGQAQAAKDELIKDGRTLEAVRADIAARTRRAPGTISDAEANRKLDEEAGNLVEVAAHQKAVRDKRSEVVSSTGDEIGFKRGEDQMNEDEVKKIEEENAKAGKPKPATPKEIADARKENYAKARQRDVSNKVGTAIRDKQEAVVTEMGGDEGGISGEDKSIRQEMGMHPDDYAGYTPITDDMTPAQRATAEAGNQKAVADAKNRDKARRTVLTNVNRQAERETRNARLKKASDAAGVGEGRRLREAAVRTELAARRGVKESDIGAGEIENAIEGSSYRNNVTAKGEEMRDSASENIGTRFGREDALTEAGAEISDADVRAFQAKSTPPGGTPPSEEVARYQLAQQADATAQLRTKLHNAEIAAGGKIGTNLGNAKIDQAAIDAEQATTLKNAHRFASEVIIGANTKIATNVTLGEDTIFPHDVTDVTGTNYPKGQAVPKNTRLKAGTEVTTGTKLAAGAILKAGTRVQRNSDSAKELADLAAAGNNKLIDQQTARRAVARKGVTSGREQAERARSQEQGQTAAYDRAASEGTPNPNERFETYEQANLETIASDTANVSAQSALAAEGRPMHRDMRSMVNSRTELARRKIITDRVAERMNQRIPWAGNVALKDVDLSSSAGTGNVVKMGRQASQDLQSGQIDLAIAFTQRMTASDEGNTEVRRRSYRRRSDGGIGRTWNRSVDQSADPEKNYDLFWAESGATAGHVDSNRPMIAGAHNPKAESFNGKGGYSNGDVQAMMDYYNLDDVGMQLEMDELRKDIADPKMPEPQKAAARDQLKRLDETVGTGRWKDQGARFVASLSDALDAEEKPGSKVQFDQQVVRTLANEAAYALQHEDDDTLLFNQGDAAKRARDAIIKRAAASGTNWYRGVGGDPKKPKHPGVVQPTIPLINYNDETGAVPDADKTLIRSFGATDAEKDALEQRVIRKGMEKPLAEIYRELGVEFTMGPDGIAKPKPKEKAKAPAAP